MDQSKNSICFVAPLVYTYLNSEAGGSPGGAERQQFLLAEELRDRGYETHFITYDNKYSPTNSYEVINGHEVWSVIPERKGFKNTHKIFVAVLIAARNIDADIYYSRGNLSLCVMTATISRLLKKNHVYCIANDGDIDETRKDRYPSMIRAAFKLSLRYSEGVVSQTNAQQDTLKKNFGIESVMITNSCVVPESNKVLGHGDREFMLWIGRLDKHQKQPEILISLAEGLPNIKFVMIGTEQNPEYFQRIQRKANTVDNITFLPYVDPDEIGEYYRRSYVLLNTSRYEGFPNTFLEAWGYATPVLSLNPILKDRLCENKIGHCADGSKDRMRNMVEFLKKNPDYRERLGENARNYVENNHSLSSITSQYEELFDRI